MQADPGLYTSVVFGYMKQKVKTKLTSKNIGFRAIFHSQNLFSRSKLKNKCSHDLQYPWTIGAVEL